MSGNLESRIWINGVLFHLNKLQNYLFIYFNVFGCFVYMYVCGECACLVSRETRKRHQNPSSGITDVCELPSEC